ncbi:OmpA family protein [Rasiella rasia]|uniref:OmpA family protein n=1 Tax=Rasiella rasia TaxID=2744027 RepID=A0A6G6GPB0_9FLAO|nr:OmpA family protein [Rasiella rasia]QIE60416.1 OmpA family protein [Rasiella rasia]
MKYNILYILFFSTILCAAQQQQGEWSLYFENDAHQLTKAHKVLIDSIKRTALVATDSIVVKGYASSPANEAYNLKLSEKRALNTKNAFPEYYTIIANGFGELQGDEAKNRRVDIMIWAVYQEKLALKNSTANPTKVPEKINDFTKMNAGEKIALAGIYFYPGRDDIRNDSYAALNELLAYLKENKSVTFRLLGHVCCGKKYEPGRDGYNNRTGKNNLSEARAKRIYNFLHENGIAKKRMSSRGYAFRYPTGKGDDFDRRVEIEIISR